MPPAHRTPPVGGVFARRLSRFEGLFFDEFESASAWIREDARLELPDCEACGPLVLRGLYVVHPDARGLEKGNPGLEADVNGAPAARLAPGSLAPGPWALRLPLPAAGTGSGATGGAVVALRLTGVARTNALAWLGRVSGLGALRRFRAQNRNRQLRILSLETAAGEIIYDFSARLSPYSASFARARTRLGLNVVGFLTAELGLGESARCMVRAADAAGIATALVPLRLNCKNRLDDLTYRDRLQDDNPHPVNVVHIDPPALRDLDHHHGPGLRAGRTTVGYFAWELPEFPDGWVPSFDLLDEVWCPSDFTRAAVAEKSPVPVLTMPHAIAFDRPAGPVERLRGRFGIPADAFVFLCLFDLNSTAARKNPRGALEAFARSGLGARGARLVIKTHNAAGNELEHAALARAVRDLPGVQLISETLPRAEIYALEAACDCFVSLHRSEGFGLAVAECMYLGKPVISTDWSATAEFVTASTGCPVRATPVVITESSGPYARGGVWAEPDLDHAAAWMTRVADDRTWASALGAAARAHIEGAYSPLAIGTRYRRRLQALASF